MNLKMILAALGLAASMGTARMAHAAEPFVKGLETCFTYVPATESDAGKNLRVNVSGQVVTIQARGSGKELMVVMEGALESRPVLYRETWSEFRRRGSGNPGCRPRKRPPPYPDPGPVQRREDRSGRDGFAGPWHPRSTGFPSGGDHEMSAKQCALYLDLPQRGL